MKTTAQFLTFALLSAAGLFAAWAIGRGENPQQLQQVSSSLIEPELLATALELRQLELTKPDAPQRTRDERKQRSRAALPASQPLKYTNATGNWSWIQPDQPPRSQFFARTKHRIVLEAFPTEERWVFERNPVAPLTGFGTRAVTHEKLVVEATWPEIIDMGLGPTWNELACVGLSNPELEQLRTPSAGRAPESQALVDSGETTSAWGLRFEIFRGPGLEVHWNQEHAVAAKIVRTVPGGFQTGELTQLSLGVRSQVVKTPLELNPTWPQVDLADWREEHHETH